MEDLVIVYSLLYNVGTACPVLLSGTHRCDIAQKFWAIS